MGNNTYLDVIGIGTYMLVLEYSVMILKNVMFAPGMRRNLLFSCPVEEWIGSAFL